jgi:Flp pilus assembly protein TadD
MPLRKGIVLPALLWSVIFLSSQAFSQDRNSVTGFVFGDDRSPIARINIELLTDTYSTFARAQTNGSGMYSFRGIPQGQYMVKVLPYGTDYEEQTRSVSLVPLSPIGRGGVSEQIDFYLTTRRNARPKQGAAAVLFVQEVPARAKELYEAGIGELDKKNEDQGYAKLRESIEEFPKYYLALDRLATEYLAKGYYEPAFVLFTKAIEVNPRSVSSLLGLGLTELRLKRYDRSIQAFNDTIKQDKENVNAYYWLGIAYHSNKNFGEAVTSLKRAEKLSEGRFAEVHWQLARVYKDQNKFRESADALETFLKVQPEAKNAEEIQKLIKTLRGKAVT